MDTPNNTEQPLTFLEQLTPRPDVYMVQKKILERPEREQVSKLLCSTPKGSIVVNFQKRDVLPDVEYYAHIKCVVNEGKPIQAFLPDVKIRLYAAIGSLQRQVSEDDEKLLSDFLVGIGYEDKTIKHDEGHRIESRIFMLPRLN